MLENAYMMLQVDIAHDFLCGMRVLVFYISALNATQSTSTPSCIHIYVT